MRIDFQYIAVQYAAPSTHYDLSEKIKQNNLSGNVNRVS